MDDGQIHTAIEKLVAEEHELLKKGEDGGLPPEEHARLQQVAVGLDQCWDLLRQRRALREAGLDPDAAAVRGADVVEHYLQ